MVFTILGYLKGKLISFGLGPRDILRALKELKKSLKDIDNTRITDLTEIKGKIRESVRKIVTGGKDEFYRLKEEIKSLRESLTSITNNLRENIPGTNNYFNSVVEWWWDLFRTIQKIGELRINSLKETITSLNIRDINLDRAAEVIAGLGVPGLILMSMIAASPWVGAPAITASLAAIGPFGMVGGIATLGILVFITRAFTKFGLREFFQAVFIKLLDKGKTIEEIIQEIERYPISKELKARLREFIREYSEENGKEMNEIEIGEEENNSE
ncbi:hypothetical protein JT359_08365 [Candidatus Poribacteria bacterium]|nr:hypothetical protein [Candidatus Poribacteria bacterium]